MSLDELTRVTQRELAHSKFSLVIALILTLFHNIVVLCLGPVILLITPVAGRADLLVELVALVGVDVVAGVGDGPHMRVDPLVASHLRIRNFESSFCDLSTHL